MSSNSKSYKLAIGIATILILVIVLITGCKQEASLANGVISEVTTAKSVSKDARPVDSTNVFTADTQDIYLSFKISHFPVGTIIKVEWIYVGGDPQSENITGKNYVAETQNATVTKEGVGYTNTVYSRPAIPGYETWPKGDYKVLISVDGQEKASTYFKVQ